jgi:hypothetical protein
MRYQLNFIYTENHGLYDAALRHID